MEELNEHQLKIINTLMFKQSARYSELNIEEMPTNQFNYHIKELISLGYIQKEEDKYILTTKGKDFAGKIDIFSGKLEKQGKISVLPVCLKEENGVNRYLIQQRKKHPNYDYYGFPAGKAKFGELLINEVLRELKEETGLIGTPVLKQINHMLVQESDQGEIVADKLFFIFIIKDLKGNFIEETIEGVNKWLSVQEIQALDLVFPDVVDTILAVENSNLTFIERQDIYLL